MAAVVARAEVVFELGAEFLGDGEVFGELRVAAVAVGDKETGWGDVFGYPVRVAGGAVVC